jgi:hypothetical protein
VYLTSIINRFENQIKKGMNKYGQPLEENTDEIVERLEHLAEELTDGLMYIEWIKEMVSGCGKCKCYKCTIKRCKCDVCSTLCSGGIKQPVVHCELVKVMCAKKH